jgi:hypothetical protein
MLVRTSDPALDVGCFVKSLLQELLAEEAIGPRERRRLERISRSVDREMVLLNSARLGGDVVGLQKHEARLLKNAVRCYRMLRSGR